MKKNINTIITGLPRSGTTLLTAMVDSAENSVALVEPMDQFLIVKSKDMSSVGYANWLAQDFSDKRTALLNGRAVLDKRNADTGQIVTNIFREDPLSMKDGFRKEGLDSSASSVRTNLSDDFNLAVKHTGPYLSVLEELLELGQLSVVLIHRDPVGVICSWRSLASHPLHFGRMPGATKYWSEMREFIDSYNGEDILFKQIKILEIASQKIRRLRDKFPERLNLIKYENLDGQVFLSKFGFQTEFEIKGKRDIKSYSDWSEVAQRIETLGVNLEI